MIFLQSLSILKEFSMQFMIVKVWLSLKLEYGSKENKMEREQELKYRSEPYLFTRGRESTWQAITGIKR